MVLESTGEKTFKMVLDLLKSLWKSSVITVDQMKRVSVVPGVGVRSCKICIAFTFS